MSKILVGFMCCFVASVAFGQQVDVHYINGRRIETNCVQSAPYVSQQVIVVNSAPAPCVSPDMQRRLYNQQQDFDRRMYNQAADYQRRVYNSYADSYRYSSSCQPVYTEPCRSDRFYYPSSCFDYRDYGRGSLFNLQIAGRNFNFGIGIRSDHQSGHRSSRR